MKSETVSCAESITAGHIQALLASVSGASDVFQGGMTAYQRSVKVSLLEVDNDLACRTDCVDEEIARQMAAGALKCFGSTYALSTCGYAEAENGRPYAFYAIAKTPTHILESGRIELHGGRIEAQQLAAQKVVQRLLDLLQADKPGN